MKLYYAREAESESERRSLERIFELESQCLRSGREGLEVGNTVLLHLGYEEIEIREGHIRGRVFLGDERSDRFDNVVSLETRCRKAEVGK